jgi:protein-S-isoprenylcysteine O-methyltransferase Ste14
MRIEPKNEFERRALARIRFSKNRTFTLAPIALLANAVLLGAISLIPSLSARAASMIQAVAFVSVLSAWTSFMVSRERRAMLSILDRIEGPEEDSEQAVGC